MGGVILGAAIPTPGGLTGQDVASVEQGPVYLAYAGPYSSSPPSAFGHLFLVLPQDSTEPSPLWDVVSFSAETNGAGPLTYLTVGIAGGFSGRYQRLDFHEKTRDYELLDDRDLWLTEIVLSAQQRRALASKLAATAGQWYPYTFFERNCAYYLQTMLARVVDDIPVPSGPTSPTDVFERILQSEVAGKSYFRPAASRRLEETGDRVTGTVMTRLRGEAWYDVAADTAWLKELSAHDRMYVQEYLSWKALKRGSALDSDAKRGIALLRVLNGRDRATRGRPERSNGPGSSIEAPDFHGYTRASLSYIDAPSASRIALKFRPALHDQFDAWTAHRPLNALEFLSIEASIAPDGEDPAPRIESVVLFSQRSLNPSTWIAGRRSWMLEVVARRGGLFSADGLHAAARTGGGKTVQVGRWLYVYGLATTAVVTDGGGVAFAPGLEAGMLVMPVPVLRLGAQWAREHDLLHWSRSHRQVEAWVRYDLAAEWGVRAMADVDEAGTSFTTTIDWYP